MQFLLVFYPILGTAMVSLFQSNVVTPKAFGITTAGASLLKMVVAAHTPNEKPCSNARSRNGQAD
jgi:hypothetical protein